MSELSIEQLIKSEYNNLSKGKKVVAKYVLNSLKKVSYSTITQLKKEIGVSETTIIRFAHAIGFNSFSQMQDEIRNNILYGPNKVDYQERNERENLSDDEYTGSLRKDIDILNDMIEHLDINSLDKAAMLISESQKVLVVGYHTAYASAYWFASTLGLMLPNIQLLNEKDYYNELLSVNESTVVVAISFPRYRKNTFNAVKRISEKKGKIIAISDSELSPIGSLADINLSTVTNRDDSGYNSISSVISLLNLLVINIRKRNQEKVKERLLELEKYYEKDDELFE